MFRGVVLSGIAALLLALNPPAAPVITEPATDGQVVHPADVHMEAGTFFDADGHAHASTDWEIWKVSTNQKVWEAPAKTGVERVHVHFADGSFVGPYAGRTALEFDLDYRLDVRFRDSNNELSPTATRPFHTSPAGPPGIAAPLPWIPAEAGYRVEVVAGGFRLPVNIAFHPNPGPSPTDPYFYVTELYGTIKVVRRNGTVSTYASNLLNYDPTALGSFPGAGEQGLAGLCVDPATGDLFATLLWQHAVGGAPGGFERWPRVVRLHSDDGGRTMATNTLVKDFPGEAQGQSHQISNVSIGPDGMLYVHMGDGFVTSTAQDLESYRGKILRMSLAGGVPANGNPHVDETAGVTASDYVWVSGVRNPFGGTWRAANGGHYMVENGPATDRFARTVAGDDFGWNGSDGSMNNLKLYNWSPAKAPVNIVFLEPQTFFGSGFPAAKMDRAYVTESGPTYAPEPQANGKRIVEFSLLPDDTALSGPHTFVEYAGTGRATAVGLAAGPDGLYFTDLYKDQGAASPSEAGAQVLRVRYVGLPPDGTGAGFRGEYFDNADFTGASVVRTDAAIDFSWAGQPDPAIGADDFSVRWLGRLEPRTSDTITFYTRTAGGVRLWVNGTLLVDQWAYHASTEHSGSLALEAGTLYDVVLEFRDDAGTAEARLRWSGPAQPKEIVPSTQVHAPDLRDNDGDGLPNTLDFDDDDDGTDDKDDADLDGDGHSNAAEVAEGTDPNDKTSFPAKPSGGGGGGGNCGLGGPELLGLLLVLYLRGIRKAN